jgi:TetR/AcrR family transcriptional repressor of mexJK operon
VPRNLDGEAPRRGIKREERRCAIVTIAQRHFAEHGFGGASMSAIAAEIGGSKATLWAYFQSKEDLFAAALSAWLDEIEPRSVAPSQGDARQRLIDYCTAFMSAMLTPVAETIFRLIVAEGQRFPELGRAYYRRVLLAHHLMLSELLEGQLRAGRLLPRSRAPSSLRAAEQLLEICMCRLLVRRVCGLELDSSADAIAREAQSARSCDFGHVEEQRLNMAIYQARSCPPIS